MVTFTVMLIRAWSWSPGWRMMETTSGCVVLIRVQERRSTTGGSTTTTGNVVMIRDRASWSSRVLAYLRGTLTGKVILVRVWQSTTGGPTTSWVTGMTIGLVRMSDHLGKHWKLESAYDRAITYAVQLESELDRVVIHTVKLAETKMVNWMKDRQIPKEEDAGHSRDDDLAIAGDPQSILRRKDRPRRTVKPSVRFRDYVL